MNHSSHNFADGSALTESLIADIRAGNSFCRVLTDQEATSTCVEMTDDSTRQLALYSAHCLI